MQWLNVQCTGLWVERLGFKTWLGQCVVLLGKVLIGQCTCHACNWTVKKTVNTSCLCKWTKRIMCTHCCLAFYRVHCIFFFNENV